MLESISRLFSVNITSHKELIGYIKKNCSYILEEIETARVLGIEEAGYDEIERAIKICASTIIDGVSRHYFGVPIEMAIATQDQETIKKIFEGAAEKFGFEYGMQVMINSELDNIANKLNKRFSFDEASLIHLIEASKGSNIQLEEDFPRMRQNVRQVLRQAKDGSYHLANVNKDTKTSIYTSGNPIPMNAYTERVVYPDGTSEEKERIYTGVGDAKSVMISAYPGGSEIEKNSPEKIMQEIMKNLFDNLELCVDMYKMFYTQQRIGNIEDSIPIENHVELADNSDFDFYYKVNKQNLPHLLGIPKGFMLPDATIRFFAERGSDGNIRYPINKNSSSFEILKAIMDNKDRIIACGGLVEENGKMYQLFPWEKMVLKTSSFMRGDFFKACFCLVELQYGLNSPNEKYATISTTRYGEDMTSHKYDAKAVLRDLLNTQRQTKDFIFRTFVKDHGRRSGYIPQSIDTGKAETIILSGTNERLKTLDRYRKMLNGGVGTVGTISSSSIGSTGGAPGSSSGGGRLPSGKIATSIENQFGKKEFSPLEQLILQRDIYRSLGVNTQVDEKTMAYQQELTDYIDSIIGQSVNDKKGPQKSK